MSQSEIEQLKCKIKELETLRDKCTLTNDIKQSLVSYIKSNEDLKKNMSQILEKKEGNPMLQTPVVFLLVEYKWILFIIISFIILSIKL